MTPQTKVAVTQCGEDTFSVWVGNRKIHTVTAEELQSFTKEPSVVMESIQKILQCAVTNVVQELEFSANSEITRRIYLERGVANSVDFSQVARK